MQIVQHLRLPIQIDVHDVARELERHAHRIAIVVVRDIVAPIHERRPIFIGMRKVPIVDINHAVAAVDLDHGCDEGDHAFADRLHIRAFIDGEAISKLHQGGRRPRLDRVNRSGDVVNRK